MYLNSFMEDWETYWVRLNNSQQYGFLAAPAGHKKVLLFKDTFFINVITNKKKEQNKNKTYIKTKKKCLKVQFGTFVSKHVVLCCRNILGS